MQIFTILNFINHVPSKSSMFNNNLCRVYT